MARLPERQRAAIALVYHQDLTNIEAAGILGVSVDALESLLSRGRRGLKKRLDGLKLYLLEDLDMVEIDQTSEPLILVSPERADDADS